MQGSSVRHSKPLCHLLNVTGRWRRGKHRSRNKNRAKSRVKTKSRRKKPDICTQADRSAFSNNLIEMISSEHSNMFGARGGPNGTILGNAKKEVAEWKFAQMDESRDGVLSRGEMRVLRDSMRKVLRPRRCGRSFLRYCDQDSDKRISKKEWSSCLGVTENSEFSPRIIYIGW